MLDILQSSHYTGTAYFGKAIDVNPVLVGHPFCFLLLSLQCCPPRLPDACIPTAIETYCSEVAIECVNTSKLKTITAL